MELRLSDNFIQLSNGDLVICNVSYNDTGIYTCQIDGSTNITRALNVIGIVIVN